LSAKSGRLESFDFEYDGTVLGLREKDTRTAMDCR
jgi:hypothetical protein